MSYESVEAVSFWDCVDSLRHDDRHKSDLVDTLLELRQDPFRSSRLRTHKIGTARNGKDLFASDVGGRRSDRRVVWHMVNRTVVVLLYGTHKIYDRAKRMRVAFDEKQRQVVIYEQQPGSQNERPYRDQQSSPPMGGNRVGKLFMAWTDEELSSFGFPAAAVVHLRRLDVDDELFDMADELGRHGETALNLVAYGHPDGPMPEPEARVADELESAAAVTDDDIDLEAQLADGHAGYWFTRTEPEFLAEVIGRPIEDWMIFLHPDQRAAVRREYDGPARVRGAAGTGKTVIGLHRAAWLAKRNRDADKAREAQLVATEPPSLPVLFTTYISSLPPVFESLYGRLPGTRHGEVQFTNVDKLARRICHESGDSPSTIPQDIAAAYNRAYKQVVVSATPLAESGHRFSKGYLQDEITTVIKGRAIHTLDLYLTIRRTGRRAPMGRLQRTQVWELMRAWDTEMSERNTVDFCDVVTRALHHARQLDTARYSAVIVDEAQDLTLAGLQLLRALVNAPAHDVDRPNGLLILGDGAQRIYPGGFNLREAGVEVRGRTTVLTENYRNTHEIISTAMAIAGESPIDDLEEQFRRGDEEVSAVRRGPRPLLVHATGLDAQLDEIVRMIGELTMSQFGCRLGDIGVLTATKSQVDAVCKRLGRQNLAHQDLKDYDGTPSSRMKVGTYFRAKGLEFKVVFLPQVTRDVFPPPPTQGSD